MPPSPALLELLDQLSRGELGIDEAAEQIATSPELSPGGQRWLPGATVDLGRQSRCGYSEVVFGAGKPVDLIAEIVRAELDAGQTALVTRIDPTAATQVRRCFDYGHHNPIAHTLRIAAEAVSPPQPLPADAVDSTVHVAVVTAGTTDIPVAEEAVETLDWMGIPFRRFDDIGVAGPQRLLEAVPDLRQAAAVVVIAGMEGALPAVVSGHLAVPVFAVPTSIGYGANLGGLTPLLSMLNACAASVAVVNIDAGFKGGYLAGLVAGQLQRHIGTER